MTDDRSPLRRWLDESMNGAGLDYGIKIDKPLEKKLGDLFTDNRELCKQVRKRLRDYGMAKSWRVNPKQQATTHTEQLLVEQPVKTVQRGTLFTNWTLTGQECSLFVILIQERPDLRDVSRFVGL